MSPVAETLDRRILLAPASGTLEGEVVFFLFPLRAVEEVLSDAAVLPVPFAPPALPGVAIWRDRVTPVIDLEAAFGLRGGWRRRKNRYLAVRSRGRSGLIRSSSGLRILRSPEGRPRAAPLDLPPELARGVFEGAEGLLVVPRVGALLSGAVPAVLDIEPEGEEGGTRMTDRVILVVEDSPTNLRLITDALRGDGYAIRTAMDGEEAIEKALSEPPDLMVLDVILPKKNGFQVCRHLRNQAETREMKILMLTSKNQESDRFWGLRQGPDEYMTKPYEMDDLRTAVRRLIEPETGS
jgi:twitching motility two-component system response regulator PilH